jgi:hypothetical protein
MIYLVLTFNRLKIQEETEEVLTLIPGSENNSISNINWKIPMHTVLIFKEQITQYNILKDMIFFAIKITSKIYICQSLRQRLKSTVLVPWIFNSSGTDYNRKEQTIRNTMTWPGLIQNVEHLLFMFHLSSMSNDKEGAKTQEIWAPFIQNSRIWQFIPGLWYVWICWFHLQ